MVIGKRKAVRFCNCDENYPKKDILKEEVKSLTEPLSSNAFQSQKSP